MSDRNVYDDPNGIILRLPTRRNDDSGDAVDSDSYVPPPSPDYGDTLPPRNSDPPPESSEEMTQVLPLIPPAPSRDDGFSQYGEGDQEEPDEDEDDGEMYRRRTLAETLADWIQQHADRNQDLHLAQAPLRKADIARKKALLEARTDNDVAKAKQNGKSRSDRAGAQGKTGGGSVGKTPSSGVGAGKGNSKSPSSTPRNGTSNSNRSPGSKDSKGTSPRDKKGTKGPSQGKTDPKSSEGTGRKGKSPSRGDKKSPGASSGDPKGTPGGSGSKEGPKGRQKGTGGPGKGSDGKAKDSGKRPWKKHPKNSSTGQGHPKNDTNATNKKSDNPGKTSGPENGPKNSKGASGKANPSAKQGKTNTGTGKMPFGTFWKDWVVGNDEDVDAQRANSAKTNREPSQDHTDGRGVTDDQATAGNAEDDADDQKKHKKEKEKQKKDGEAGWNEKFFNGDWYNDGHDRHDTSWFKFGQDARGEDDHQGPGPWDPEQDDDVQHWVERADRPPHGEARDSTGEPAGIAPGPKALPHAPEPHTERPGTTRPTTEEANVTDTSTGSAHTTLAPEHQASITIQDFTDGMQKRADVAARHRDVTGQLSIALTAIAQQIRATANKLERDDNISPKVVDEADSLADDVDELAAGLQHWADDNKTRADYAHKARQLVERVYGEDEDAAAASGLDQMSAASHH